jgi:hypothetical protein
LPLLRKTNDPCQPVAPVPSAVMTARPTILTTIRAPLQKVNERERDVLSRWANSQGWNVLTRCGWSFGHSRAPQSLRLCGDPSFAVFAPSREKCSVWAVLGVDHARPGSKRKTQRRKTTRKQTSGTSHGLVQQRIASTLRTRPQSIMAIHASPRVLRSKLCLEVRPLDHLEADVRSLENGSGLPPSPA